MPINYRRRTSPSLRNWQPPPTDPNNPPHAALAAYIDAVGQGATPSNVAVNAAIATDSARKKAFKARGEFTDLASLLSRVQPGEFPSLEDEAIETAKRGYGPDQALGLAENFAKARAGREQSLEQARSAGRAVGARRPRITNNFTGPLRPGESPPPVYKTENLPDAFNLATYERNPGGAQSLAEFISRAQQRQQNLMLEAMKNRNAAASKQKAPDIKTLYGLTQDPEIDEETRNMARMVIREQLGGGRRMTVEASPSPSPSQKRPTKKQQESSPRPTSEVGDVQGARRFFKKEKK